MEKELERYLNKINAKWPSYKWPSDKGYSGKWKEPHPDKDTLNYIRKINAKWPNYRMK
ncbi:MAG: hypothetical protein H0Z24_06905 [Thermosipho sp. (in: Bacteria)]|nr:hypothetical protein [Thermosipho sp. (in: thermotogales)]